MRYTPENITELKPDEVFVFGSNAAGRHAAAAAKVAVERFGAIWGEGEGMQGQSYAIPTMKGWEELQRGVKEFLALAKRNPQLTFYVTKIGCGIAGYTEDEMSPLFKDAPNNVMLPKGWK